jgi:AcrR family transcriptional regulator
MASELVRKAWDPDRRRDLLLMAAERVFGRKPYDEASLHEIAEEAQVGIQRFYEFFPTKEALYQEMQLLHARAFQNSARDIPDTGLSAEAELRALTFAVVRHFHDHPAALPVFVRFRSVSDWGLESRFTASLSIYQACRAQFQQCIAKLADSGRLRPLPLDFLTELYLDILQACLHFQHRCRIGEEVSVCVARVLESFLQGAGERQPMTLGPTDWEDGILI